MARLVHGYKIAKRKHYIPAFVLWLCVLVVIIGGVGHLSELSVLVILKGLAASLYRLFLAYIISIVIAYILSILVSQSRLGNIFIPIFDLMQNLPSFALIPLFVYFFGYTNTMAVIFATTSILWPILFYLLHSFKMSRADFNDAATIFGAKGWKRVVYYLIPLSLPAAVTGSIVGFSIGWEAIIGIEIIGLSNGIGSFLNLSLLGGDKPMFALGLSILLFVVFIINRVLWMPLMARSQNYEE